MIENNSVLLNEFKPKNVLVILKPEELDNVVSKILNETKAEALIYVSINRPIASVCNSLKKFFDLIPVTIINVGSVKLDDFTCKAKIISSAELNDLTTLSILVTEALTSYSNKRVLLIFDSINSLLLFNKKQFCFKFLSFSFSKLLKHNALSFFLTFESNEYSDFLNSISQFVDETKRID